MSDPKFIPLNGGPRAAEEFQQIALGVRARRQSMLASNIANADTPNYKAVDMNFEEALRAAQNNAAREPMALKTTASGHIAAKSAIPPPTGDVLYRVPAQASADGNTVEMDAERSKFAENAVQYEFSLQHVGNDFKDMIQLLNNLK